MSEVDDRSGFVPPLNDGSSLSLVADPSVLAETTTPPEDSMRMESGANDTPQLVEDPASNVTMLHHRVSSHGKAVLLTPETLPAFEKALMQSTDEPGFARSLISFSQRLIHPIFSRVAS